MEESAIEILQNLVIKEATRPLARYIKKYLKL